MMKILLDSRSQSRIRTGPYGLGLVACVLVFSDVILVLINLDLDSWPKDLILMFPTLLISTTCRQLAYARRNQVHLAYRWNFTLLNKTVSTNHNSFQLRYFSMVPLFVHIFVDSNF